jgi:predicted enzyme related to lactoylglutathione lyase
MPQHGPVPPHWLIYFTVNDCDGDVARANRLGGKTVVPPMDIPSVGRFAVLADPAGATFAIIKLTFDPQKHAEMKTAAAKTPPPPPAKKKT